MRTDPKYPEQQLFEIADDCGQIRSISHAIRTHDPDRSLAPWTGIYVRSGRGTGHHPYVDYFNSAALAVVALFIMPWLVCRKRDIAERIHSPALRGDAACSLTCAYMAGALLVGVALTTLFGWWWVDGVAALVLLYWIVPEAREALEGARAGRGGCGCGGDDLLSRAAGVQSSTVENHTDCGCASSGDGGCTG